MNKKIIIPVGVVIVLLAGAGIYYMADDSSERLQEASDTFTRAVMEGDADTSYELMDRSLQNQVQRAEGWEERLALIETDREYSLTLRDQFEIPDPDHVHGQEDTIRSFVYEVEFDDGSVHEFRVFTVWRDGEAHIIEFDSVWQQ